MENRHTILLFGLCCLAIGILIVVLPIADPDIYEYQCGTFDIFCFEWGIWSTVFMIIVGIGIMVLGIIIILYLIYWWN